MPVLRNDQFNYRDEFEPYFKEPEDIRYRDDAVLGTLVETAAYQRLDRDQLRTMTPRQIDQATRKLRKSLEVREHDRTAIDQAWQDAPRGEQITNDLAELERALGHRPGWADYTAMLRERETEHLPSPRSRMMQTPSRRRRHGRRERATAQATVPASDPGVEDHRPRYNK